ncbi:MAG: T9SS type A sorting domain-containing protein [Bacteroidota bacterium]
MCLSPDLVVVGGDIGTGSCVFLSEDGGESFIPIDESNSGPEGTVRRMVWNSDESILFVAAPNGPFAYERATGNWYDIRQSGAPAGSYFDVDYLENPERLRFSIWGRGAWELALDEYEATVDFDTEIDNSALQSSFTFTGSSDYETLEWDFGDGNFSTEENPLHQYNQLGEYEVCLIFSNDCLTDTTCQTINLTDPLSTDQLKDGVLFTLFPNPSRDNIRLKGTEGWKEAMTATIYDSSGRLIDSYSLSDKTEETIIDISNLAEGTYLLVVSNEKGNLSAKKFLKTE